MKDDELLPEKFTKKPVTIEAWQFTEEVALNYWENKILPPFGCRSVSGEYNKNTKVVRDAYFHIDTLEGFMKASLGDWIIKGVKGEIYPCKPDIFEATYTRPQSPPQDKEGALEPALKLSDREIRLCMDNIKKVLNAHPSDDDTALAAMRSVLNRNPTYEVVERGLFEQQTDAGHDFTVNDEGVAFCKHCGEFMTFPTKPCALTPKPAEGNTMADFEKYFKGYGLDFTKSKDAWGKEIYKHTHIDSMWAGWSAASGHAPIADVEAGDNMEPAEGWMFVVRKNGQIEHVKTAETLMKENAPIADLEGLKREVYTAHIKRAGWTDEMIAEELAENPDWNWGYQYGAQEAVDAAIDHLASRRLIGGEK